nr:hypothetical protein Itr_chr08CG09660 [Ipomoea trifida]
MVSFSIAAREVQENMLLLEDDWGCRDLDEFFNRNPSPSQLTGVVSLGLGMDASLGEMGLGSAVRVALFDEPNASMKLPILSCEVFDEMPRRVERVMLESEEILVLLLLVVEEVAAVLLQKAT